MMGRWALCCTSSSSPRRTGLPQDGCVEYLLKSRPEAVLDVHREYLKAGADIIETNSFGGTRIVLAEVWVREPGLKR